MTAAPIFDFDIENHGPSFRARIQNRREASAVFIDQFDREVPMKDVTDFDKLVVGALAKGYAGIIASGAYPNYL